MRVRDLSILPEDAGHVAAVVALAPGGREDAAAWRRRPQARELHGQAQLRGHPQLRLLPLQAAAQDLLPGKVSWERNFCCRPLSSVTPFRWLWYEGLGSYKWAWPWGYMAKLPNKCSL